MPRFACKLEYHGGAYCGWQRQRDLPSVQGVFESALSALESGPHVVVAAGRTDAGVHALGQVIHIDTERTFEPFRLSEALNHYLKPAQIAVLDCVRVSDDWHARFSAIKRHYLFRILVRRAPATHDDGLVWHVKRDLNVEAMQRAANHLMGHHDFTTFRSSICQAASPLKTLDEITIERIPKPIGEEIHVHARARSFLHKQVRSIVGTLERVGAGAWSPEDVRRALTARNRAACGPVSPPDGLYLQDVSYSEDPFTS